MLLNKKRRRGQSIVEYAILLAIIMAAIVIMQIFVKRGVQGGLKDASDKMGDQFSASGTTIYQENSLTGTQTITEEVATNTITTKFLPGGKSLSNAAGTIGTDTYSYSSRSGGTQTAVSAVKTDSATAEDFKWSDHKTKETTVSDWGTVIPGEIK